MIYHDVPQRSEEWHHLRAGRLTASEANTIATNGKGLETYCYAIMAEKYAIGQEERYVSLDMERGIALEEQALDLYSLLYEPIEKMGFIEIDKYVGFSPDALINNRKGGVEAKCPNNAKYFRLLVNGEKEIEKQYLWQCQMQMFLGEWDYVDLIFYNPNFEKSLLVFRQTQDQEMREKLMIGIEKGKKLIQEIEEKL